MTVGAQKYNVSKITIVYYRTSRTNYQMRKKLMTPICMLGPHARKYTCAKIYTITVLDEPDIFLSLYYARFLSILTVSLIHPVLALLSVNMDKADREETLPGGGGRRGGGGVRGGRRGREKGGGHCGDQPQ